MFQLGAAMMRSRKFFEVHVKVGDDWKLSASFESETEARVYVKEMRKKVSYRIIRDSYDGESEKFKGRRILQEVILDTPPVVGTPAARAKAQEDLLAQRHARKLGIQTAGSPSSPENDADVSLFERFVETLKDEASKKDA